MHVKVFEATDMASGLSMIRKELGPDALIISTRTVKNGKLGVLGKSILEITAATDSKPQKRTTSRNISPPQKMSNEHRLYRQNGLPEEDYPLDLDESSVTGDLFNMKNKRPLQNDTVDQTSLPQPPNQIPEEFKKEMTELKKMVLNLSGEMDRYGKKIDGEHDKSALSALETNIALQNLFQNEKNTRDPITNFLLSYGINLKNALALTAKVKSTLENTASQEIIEDTARRVISDLIKPAVLPTFKQSGNQRRIAFVGPTGVGKTTTLAKIAAQYLTTVSDSIALITIDTYRIAAVEQLKVYGELMNIPVDVVINPRQLDQALFQHRDKDLVLIDTAGRSPHDSLSFEELATFFLPDFDIENHLVLSSTTRESELTEICKQFSKLDITNLIMTKTDECSKLGVILNLQLESGIPLSYITNGQRVPEDLIEANQQKLAELIIPISEGILHD